MSEIAEKNARKLTPADRRTLCRELAAGEIKRAQLARLVISRTAKSRRVTPTALPVSPQIGPLRAREPHQALVVLRLHAADEAPVDQPEDRGAAQLAVSRAAPGFRLIKAPTQRHNSVSNLAKG